MLNKNQIFTIIALLFSASQMLAQTIIDISNPDSETSIYDAIKQTREMRRLNVKGIEKGITINLGNRCFQLTKPIFIRPEDSGTSESPTLITGGRLSGNIKLSGWKIDTESGLWVCDPPKVANRIIYTRQLWVNDKKALRAQECPAGKMNRMIGFNKEDRTITIPASNIKTFDMSKATELEMMVHQRWATAILRIKEIKIQDDEAIVSFHDPESELEFTHPWPQPVIGEEKGNSSYCLMNALAFVDEPGEWYQEYPSGRIFYKPGLAETPESIKAEIPLLDNLVTIQGEENRPVEFVSFENTTFSGSAWYRPSLEGHVTLQGGFRMIDAYKLLEPGLFHKATLENQAWIARPEASVIARYSNSIAFRNCNFIHLSATALDLEKNITNSTIEDCKFEDIGGTAIMAGYFGEQGWETHIPYLGKNICSDILIKGNAIHDATNEDWGAVGIACGYVKNTIIDRNSVSHLNYSGICLGWGWTRLESGMRNNHITNNNVSDFARQLYDAGGIYTLSNQPESSIIGNTISAPYPAPYATNDRGFCIYFDEATDGFTVKDNIMPYKSYGWNQPGPNMNVEK